MTAPGRTLDGLKLHYFVHDRFDDEIHTELSDKDFAGLAQRIQEALLDRYDNIEAGPDPFSIILGDDTITFCQVGSRGHVAKRLCWVAS